MKECGYSDYFSKLNEKVNDPKMTFDPTSVEVTCVTLSKDHFIQVPWKYIKVCGYSDPFFKNLNQRSLTPRWPLTPHLLRSHVWLYPRIIVSQVPWKYIKVCGYSDPFFKNLNQRSLTPRWPLTPHLLRSHVWLYPRIIVSESHGNTSMYVDTVINFAKYYILHRPTTDRMSDHIASFWTKFRRDKKDRQSLDFYIIFVIMFLLTQTWFVFYKDTYWTASWPLWEYI